MRLRNDSDERLAQLRTAGLAARERAHTAALDRARSDARTRTAREWLVARAEALDQVFGAANETLAARSADPGFVVAVAGITRDALLYLPPGDASARCATSLAPAVRTVLESQAPGRPALRVIEDDAVATGVVLETADRSLAIDATFARRLARERPRLAIEVARQLESAEL
ncbi:MAG TPA: V-type ATP synthase subunit E family protein [Gemmatimonadaceae bacterium]|nr:V-type ATP synthase subunit E family protein [Gemmatimonadaceae bacterium]